MPDRETVITHLQIIHTWAEFARERDLQFFTPKHLEDIAQWTNDAISMLKEQETVVRCKDCKHWYFADNRIPSEQENVCGRNGTVVTPDWFCADGEKRNDLE